jgi:uncharacterized membrane protein YebE (DUF533 family)
METNPIAAMATWVGALARGGLLMSHDEEEGATLAMDVLGEEGLSELREWFASQTADVVSRERRGAIHACVWMAQADREVATEEVELLEQIIANSELPPKVQEELEAAIDEPLEPEDIAEELTQPGLRELMLALTWELAVIDNRVHDEERTAHHELAEAFGVSDERAAQIRDAVLEE